jgi:crossover junction endodeoxyribonuclease RuvC
VIILGIDPGIVCAGFSVVTVEHGRIMLLDYGYVRLSPSAPIPSRLSTLHDAFSAKIEQFKVTDLVFETPFLGKNAQNFLKLGYVRGILYLLAHRYNLVVHEFSPREVKRAITGSGAAEKEQLARVLLRLFPGLELPDRYDVTDAIALSLCGVWNRRPPVSY